MSTIPKSIWPNLVEVPRLSLPYYTEQFALTEERLSLMATNFAEFRRILEKGAEFTGMQNSANKIGLTEQHFFSEEMLQAMICGGESYRMEPVPYIWGRLVKAGIVSRAFGHMQGAFCDHVINMMPLLRHLSSNTFQNIFYPPSNLVHRYEQAIVSIDVETAKGDIHRGTGFVAITSSGDSILVTCRHNVDPAKGIQIKKVTTSAGTNVELVESLVLSDMLDIAFWPLLGSATEPLFRFGQETEIFDEVFTLGFPLVPHAKPTLIGHRGEVNGHTSLYADNAPILLISNLVSPGSSGCPVLSMTGFCVGMTIDWLEAEYGPERARFSAALPAATISTFVNAGAR